MVLQPCNISRPEDSVQPIKRVRGSLKAPGRRIDLISKKSEAVPCGSSRPLTPLEDEGTDDGFPQHAASGGQNRRLLEPPGTDSKAQAMDRGRYQLIRKIFLKARGLADAVREAYLAEVCAEDAQLRREVEDLLAGQNADGDFLAHTAFGRLLASADDKKAPNPFDASEPPGE